MSAVLDGHRSGATTTVAPAGPARVAALLALVVAVAGSVIGPTGGFDGLLGGNQIRVASGVVEALRGGTWERVPDGGIVAAGTTIRTTEEVATLAVPGGEVDLAPATRLVAGPDLELEAGTAIVQSPRMAVGDGAVAAQGAGAWRFDAVGRVGVYEGAVVVTEPTGRDVLVRPLEQLHVRAGVAEPSRPYVYVGDDPFDREHLAPAFRVDELVAALGRGLAADYGTTPQPLAFYTDFDGLDGQLVALLGDVGFERAGDRVGPPADVLVASVVTEALVVDAGLDPAAAAEEVRSERLDGAAWGLITHGRDLDATHVRAAADRALTRRQLAEDQGTATPVTTPPPATDDEPADPDEGEAAPPPGDAGPDPDDGGTDPGGDPGEEPEPEPEEPGPVGGVVEDLGADDALPEPLDGVVDDTVDLVDDVIGGTGDLVEDTTDTLGNTVDDLLGG